MLYITLLILLGILFLVAELVLLPGVTVTGILAVACGGGAIYIAFNDYSSLVGIIVTIIVALLSLVTIVLSLRAKTWQRFALKSRIEAQAATPIEKQVKVGARGITISRLSPIGKVEIGGKVYEAKLISGYADPDTEIEVVGYENFDIIVKITKK